MNAGSAVTATHRVASLLVPVPVPGCPAAPSATVVSEASPVAVAVSG